MRVRVLYFGVLKDLLAADGDELEVAEGGTVLDLMQTIAGRASKLPSVWKSIAIAVNQEYVAQSTPLRDGDEVALLPPVSGGKGETGFACMLS